MNRLFTSAVVSAAVATAVVVNVGMIVSGTMISKAYSTDHA